MFKTFLPLKVGQTSVLFNNQNFYGGGLDWAQSIGIDFCTSLELRPGSPFNKDEPNYYIDTLSPPNVYEG